MQRFWRLENELCMDLTFTFLCIDVDVVSAIVTPEVCPRGAIASGISTKVDALGAAATGSRRMHLPSSVVVHLV